MPTTVDKAIHVDDYHFHRIPNPVLELHRIEPYKELASKIEIALIEAINKLYPSQSYEFDLLQPVILNFSRKRDHNGNDLFKISYPGIGGKTIHEIEANFGNEVFYPGGEWQGESPLDGWLENSSNQIAQSLFA